MLICDGNFMFKDGMKDKNILMIVSGSNEGILLIILIKVDGIRCCVLIDIGVGSFYVLGKLIDLFKKKFCEIKIR